MEFVEQSPRELTFGIFHSDSFPKTTDLVSRTVTHEGLNVQLTIIGESHTVRIFKGDLFVFGEMLACIELEPSESPHFSCFREGDMFNYGVNGYTTRLQLADGQPREHDKEDNAIEYRFPLTHGVIPVTRVNWRFVPNGIIWETLHSYPSQKGVQIVLSRSRVIFSALRNGRK